MADKEAYAPARSAGSAVATAKVEEFTPPVDVFEDEKSITLYADMPGVSEKSLEVSIDKGKLTLRGIVSHAEAAGRPIYVESREGNYLRSFTLSDDVDAGGITASIADGVLCVRIPKTERATARRIKVERR